MVRKKYYVQGVTVGELVRWHLLERPMVYDSIADWLVQKRREKVHAENKSEAYQCVK